MVLLTLFKRNKGHLALNFGSIRLNIIETYLVLLFIKFKNLN